MKTSNVQDFSIVYPSIARFRKKKLCVAAGLTVLGTSVYGGAIMAGSLDYFVEKFLMVKWVWDRVALKPSPAPCWFGWLILAVWPLMVLIGIITQWAVTGRGIHHQEREWMFVLSLFCVTFFSSSRRSFLQVVCRMLVTFILELLILLSSLSLPWLINSCMKTSLVHFDIESKTPIYT